MIGAEDTDSLSGKIPFTVKSTRTCPRSAGVWEEAMLASWGSFGGLGRVGREYSRAKSHGAFV